MRDPQPLGDQPLRDGRAYPAQDLPLLVGDAGVDDARETLEHRRKRSRLGGRSGARAQGCLGADLTYDTLTVPDGRRVGTSGCTALRRATVVREAMPERRD